MKKKNIPLSLIPPNKVIPNCDQILLNKSKKYLRPNPCLRPNLAGNVKSSSKSLHPS